MRGHILRGAHDKMNGQFYALFHGDNMWPKLLVFVIIFFCVTIFTLFVLSYAYIFSGLMESGKGSASAPLYVDEMKDSTLLPQDINASLSTNVSASIVNDTTVPSSALSTPQASVYVNDTTVPVTNGGSVHKEISTESGYTAIDVSVQSNGSSSSESSSSIDLSVTSSSSTKGTGQ